MTNFTIEIRSRACSSKTIQQKHAELAECLRGSIPPLALRRDKEFPPAPDPGAGLIATRSLSRCLGRGVQGWVSYQFRRDFRDEASEDDFATFEFNAGVFNSDLIMSALPELIVGFDAYYAAFYNSDVPFYDFLTMRLLGKDSRCWMYRLHAAVYMDRELCRRAFKTDPETFKSKCIGAVELVDLLGDGVYVVHSRQLLSYEEEVFRTGALTEDLRRTFDVVS